MSNVLQGEIYYWSGFPADHPMGQKRHMWVVISSATFNSLNKQGIHRPKSALIQIRVPAGQTLQKVEFSR